MADVVLLLALASSADAPPSGSWRTFLATLGALTALLGLQSLARLAQAPRVQALGSPAALAVAATQLLDGVVSYLAVRNPFGWLEEPHREQVRVSAILLEQTGPGFVLAKWGLALA
ncbi:MAG TPA: hypothetical protein VFH47_05710, partial [Candidatus Thermoplasmatota archaeon]|nr:hypothetical protein [Candidatus Thermoplasmatota archaeon]